MISPPLASDDQSSVERLKSAVAQWKLPLEPKKLIAIGAGALIAVVSIVDFGAYVRLHRDVPLVVPAQKPAPTTVGDTKLLDIPTENFKRRKKVESDGDDSIIPPINTAPAKRGTLDLNSVPAGARIYLDGRDSGEVTPARLIVNAGQHRIALRKDGYRPEITYAEVTPGKSSSFAPVLTPRAAVEHAASRSK